MAKYLIAHDLGTSGNKATLFTSDGEMLGSTIGSYDTHYYNNNWVEQNPADWWKAVCDCSRKLVSDTGIDAAEVVAVSFSGQMMGCLCVDKDGTPLQDSIIWADGRSLDEVEFLNERIDIFKMFSTTGQKANVYCSLEKLMWVKNNKPDIYKNTYKMLNAKDYIIFKLTGQFVTDYSDASETNMFDLHKFEWSEEVLDVAGIDMAKLPDALPSIHVVGNITAEAAQACGLTTKTQVVVGGGDGACATVGAGSVRDGDTYCCLGSSSWIAATRKELFVDEKMRIFNFAHLIPKYVSPGGTMQAAGASFNWMKNQMCRYETEYAKEQGTDPYTMINEQIGASPAGANNLLYLPYLMGERAPRWDPHAKGCFIGLKMEHTHGDMLRSVCEGISYNLRIILDVFREYMTVDDISIMGGLAKSPIFSQILTDIWDIDAHALNHLDEATSIGAAVAAGVGVGVLDGFEDVDKFVQRDKHFAPNPDNRAKYDQLLQLFDDSYYALQDVFVGLSK